MKKIYFVTGNPNKFREVKNYLLHADLRIEIERVSLDLREIQGTPDEIIIDKVKRAYEQVKEPVLVEDVSLEFGALNGLPGPYIKWFLKKLRPEGLWDLVSRYEDHSATAKCYYAFYSPDTGDPKIFTGETKGKIVEPRGARTFGWDPVFMPDGFDQTYSEMPIELKNRISHRAKALNVLISYLKELSN